MVPGAALSLLLASAQGDPPRPPDGTYTYTLHAGAASVPSTVVVQSSGATFTVSEQTTLHGASVLVRTAYDAATVLPTHYEVHQRSGLQNTDLMAAVTANSITFNGAPLKYTAGTEAKFILIGEGLAGYRMMMPWTLLAQHRAPLTFVALNGNQTLPAKTILVSTDRPASVSAADDSLAAQIGDDTLTFWYNPRTHMTDEADSVSGSPVALQSYKPEVTVLVESQTAEHAPLASAHYTDSDVSIRSSGAVLAGTLSIPDGDAQMFPAIVLVHGSGPQTRDGGTPANPTFLLLANALSNNGIAVLRYDKRGIGKSTGTASEDWHPLGDDVRAAVAFLKKQPRIDAKRIFVLGHSEGALVVPLMANSLGVRGIVLMAAPARPLADILIQQGYGKMPAAQRKMLDDAFAAYRGIDPAAVIARVTVPMLLLQGGKDSQVLAKDFPRLLKAAQTARSHVHAKLFVQDDHLFTVVPASQAMQSVDDLVQPHAVDARVSTAITTFIISGL